MKHRVKLSRVLTGIAAAGLMTVALAAPASAGINSNLVQRGCGDWNAIANRNYAASSYSNTAPYTGNSCGGRVSAALKKTNGAIWGKQTAQNVGQGVYSLTLADFISGSYHSGCVGCGDTFLAAV